VHQSDCAILRIPLPSPESLPTDLGLDVLAVGGDEHEVVIVTRSPDGAHELVARLGGALYQGLLLEIDEDDEDDRDDILGLGSRGMLVNTGENGPYVMLGDRLD